jgi:hypothetical protein
VGKTNRRNVPPHSGGLKSRLDKSKKENMALRVLTNRQRRNIKDLTSIIIGAKRAAEKGDMVRCFALVSANVKYPPSAAIDCNHEYTTDFVSYCQHCKEVQQ